MKFLAVLSFVFVISVLVALFLVVLLPTLDILHAHNPATIAVDGVKDAATDANEALENGPIGTFFEWLDSKTAG